MGRRHLVLAALAVGCSPDAGVGIVTIGGSEGTGADDAPTSDATSGSAADSTESSSTSDASESGGALFDVGAQADVPAYDDCQKIDFVFVVDGSPSMEDDRANLIANFPAFIGGIEDTLSAVSDYHVGVIPAIKWFPQSDAECEWNAPLVTTNDYVDCGPYAEGHNFMTPADDLDEAFSCAADFSTGDFELPIWALQQTVEETQQGPGECNEGFLRDDSLLVVVIITDEADGPGDPELAECEAAEDEWIEYVCPSTTPGTPPEWFDSVVAARGGIETNVVVLSLVHYAGGPCPPEAENAAQWDGQNIVDFTQMFTHGIVAGICEESYAPYFQQAVGVVADACAGFEPPG